MTDPDFVAAAVDDPNGLAQLAEFAALGDVGDDAFGDDDPAWTVIAAFQIDEAGVLALTRAIDGGQLPSLRTLHVSGNPVRPEMVEAAVRSVEKQAEAGGGAKVLRPTPQTRDIESTPVE